MSGFEDRVASFVIDVATRSNADSAHLCRESIGQVVTVQIRRGDDVKIGGASEHLLKSDVSNRIFDQNSSGLERLCLLALAACSPLGFLVFSH